MKLELLGTDAGRDWFVIFYIDRGEDLNAYIWVYDGGNVRITDIYGMERYCRHSVSGIYVGKDIPQELVDGAYDILKSKSGGEIKEMLDAFNENDAEMKEDEEEYREREEYEDACMEAIKNGEYDKDGLFWFM